MIVPPPYTRDRDLWEAAIAHHGHSGTGTASLLPMTDDEKAAVVKRPIGFAPGSAPRPAAELGDRTSPASHHSRSVVGSDQPDGGQR